MADFFLFLFFGLCMAILCVVIAKPKCVYEYPFFMGCMFAIFLLPQALSFKLNPAVAPAPSIAITFLMCFLCLLMALLGYYFGPAIVVAKYFDRNLNPKQLVAIAHIYAVCGGVILLLMNRNPAAHTERLWTGVLTIYNTLYQVLFVAFSIYVFLAIQTKKRLYIALAFLAGLPILQMIIFAGRREPTTLFVLTLLLALFYIKGVVPSRLLIVSGLVFTMLIMPIIGLYRQTADKDPVGALATLDFKKSFIKYYEEGADLELTVAAQTIDATTYFGNYDFGGAYWNEMVFRYFPAQVFGKEAKASLMIGTRGVAAYKTSFVALTGLTSTCVGDAFQHFGYFGCLFYFFLGGMFRELWRLSLVSNVFAKTFYIICMVQALVSVSHGTANFLPGVFHMFVYLFIATVFARVKGNG